MMILGIDPGATTGWCAYDTAGFVVASGVFQAADLEGVPLETIRASDAVVIERPRGQGPTYPQVVECGIVFGQLLECFRLAHAKFPFEIYRYQIRQALYNATHGTVSVRNDRSVWEALVLLHGEGCDRRPKTKKGEVVEAGGPLGGVKAHARAALACAYAWWIVTQPEPL